MAAKPSFGQCKCCLKETYLRNMWYTGKGQDEVYGQMLVDCFAIDWMIQGNLNDDKICESCISKLRVAVCFKNQVLATQAGILDSSKVAVAVEDVQEGETIEEEADEKEADEEEADEEEEEADEEDSINPNEDQEADDKKGSSEKIVAQNSYDDVEFLEEEVMDDGTNDDDDSQDYQPEQKKRKWAKKPARDRHLQYRRYTEEDLKKAVEAVKEKQMNTIVASQTFNIPRKTISKRLYDNTDGGRVDEQIPQAEMDSLLCKHRENIRSILVASNATPIKGHWGFGYACYFCPQQFQEASQLKKHTFTHGALLPSIKMKSLTDHIVKLDVTDLKCNICNIKIPALDDLMLHLKESHTMLMYLDIPNHIVPFSFASADLKCVKCQRVFNTFKNLSEHMNDAHYRNYECNVCGRGFVNLRFLKTHSIAHGINIFPCTYCLRIFSSRTEVINHEKAHMNNSLENVSIDEKLSKISKGKKSEIKFANVIMKVARHVKSMDNVTEHKCKRCPKIFESRSDLLYHINLVHKPHKCDVCESTFDFKFMLKKHVLKEHSSHTYGCPKCPKLYNKESLLKEHMLEHAGKDYCCEVCCCSFLKEESYMVHMKNKHGLE